MLTRAWTPLRYHPQQTQLWRTRKRFVAVAAGRGSGKTELARRRVVRYLPVKKPWPDPIYFYALPTMNQAKRVAWNPLKKLIPPDWIRRESQAEMIIETVFGSTLYVIGLDKPMRAEGVQWDGGVIDESCDQKPGVFARNFGPALTHKNAWCWRIGVPKRFGVGAIEFKEFFQLGQKGVSNEIESFTWSSEDILTPEQLAFMQQTLDVRDYNEQYRASWESAGGGIFYAYDDVLNVSEVQYSRRLPLCIGSDFNVDPMCWTIAQIHYPNDDDTQRHDAQVKVIDEIFVRNTNTPAALDYLFQKYGEHSAGFEFYGDAAARQRKTSASVSDYLHIRNDKRFKSARIFYPESNPRRVDRFAACNAMFLNAAGARRLLVHPRCARLRRDLQERVWKQGLMEPDDYGDIGHMSDALGYMVYRRFPIVALVEGTSEVGFT